jgi:hypothetical protein
MGRYSDKVLIERGLTITRCTSFLQAPQLFGLLIVAKEP